MKRLTGVTVVLAGIAAIGGIFGMSEAGTAFAARRLGLLARDRRDNRPGLLHGLGPAPDRLDLGRIGRHPPARRRLGSGADVGRKVLAGEGGAGGDEVGRRALEDDPARRRGRRRGRGR